jgi:hypothetical protein
MMRIAGTFVNGFFGTAPVTASRSLRTANEHSHITNSFVIHVTCGWRAGGLDGAAGVSSMNRVGHRTRGTGQGFEAFPY